jgi:maltooligosyltrehalose trehalohydrolase
VLPRSPVGRIGAYPLGEGRYRFSVWAPLVERVELKLTSPVRRLIPLTQDEQGYWQGEVEGIPPGPVDYLYRLHTAAGVVERPDPASRCQPYGVHGPSRVVDPHFDWQDQGWKGIPLSQWILYELHVGTFTPEGTFAAIIPRLPQLVELGVNVLELMPVAQFPGERNWGYDGVYPYAVQTSYGGAAGLKALVNACHQQGLAVVLDVVYNHLGPEGNYLGDFGPYFADKYRTPWGKAMNFDGPYSDGVREFFLQNAEYWLEEFHLDGLRLDAVHAIYDFSAYPFLQELAERVDALEARTGWPRVLVAESDLNDVRLITPRKQGGYGLDAQWCDDFHHSVHTLLTGEKTGYYQDFGQLEHLAKAYRESYVYSGQYSRYRARRHGNSAVSRPGSQFVICIQNHDQVGNRMLGERLSQLTSFRGPEVGRRCPAASSHVAAAVYGGRVWGGGPLSLLHQPRGSQPGESGAPGTPPRVQRLCLAGRAPGSPGRGDLLALQAELGVEGGRSPPGSLEVVPDPDPAAQNPTGPPAPRAGGGGSGAVFRLWPGPAPPPGIPVFACPFQFQPRSASHLYPMAQRHLGEAFG